MTLILGGTLKFSGLGVWFVGDSFILFGVISSHCLFSHLTDCRLGKRVAKPKGEAVTLNDPSFLFLFSDASELVFLFCLHVFYPASCLS